MTAGRMQPSGRCLSYFVDEPLLDSELPAAPLVEPMPDVAPGAEAGDSAAAEGVLGGGVMVELGDEPVLGVVVLGVVVVLEGLLLSFLPQADSAAAATNTNTKACFTM